MVGGSAVIVSVTSRDLRGALAGFLIDQAW